MPTQLPPLYNQDEASTLAKQRVRKNQKVQNLLTKRDCEDEQCQPAIIILINEISPTNNSLYNFSSRSVPLVDEKFFSGKIFPASGLELDPAVNIFL